MSIPKKGVIIMDLLRLLDLMVRLGIIVSFRITKDKIYIIAKK